MRTGRDEYGERYDRGRDVGDFYDERMRDGRWRDDQRQQARRDEGRDDARRADERARRSFDREGDDDFRRGEPRRGREFDESRSMRRDDGAPSFPPRSRPTRGERYGLTEWSPGERARGSRDDAPDGMGWHRSPGPLAGRTGDDEDLGGRAAFGRDQYGRDDYGAYGDAMAPGPPHLSGKGPKGWQRSDERIREDVSEALARHSELDPSDIEVEVDGGEVTLSGTVSDRRTKRMAEDVAETIFAVQDVHNHLRIRRQGANVEKDAEERTSSRSAGETEARGRAKGRTSSDSSSPNSR